MPTEYNLYNLEASFRKYLVAEKVSSITLRNYLSDFRYFCGWIESTSYRLIILNSMQELVVEISKLLSIIRLSEYKDYLQSNKLPIKTINRRLSTLRKFCSFCISQGWLKENPAKQLQNVKTADFLRVKLDSSLSEFSEIHPEMFEDVREFYSIISLQTYVQNKG